MKIENDMYQKQPIMKLLGFLTWITKMEFTPNAA